MNRRLKVLTGLFVLSCLTLGYIVYRMMLPLTLDMLVTNQAIDQATECLAQTLKSTAGYAMTDINEQSHGSLWHAGYCARKGVLIEVMGQKNYDDHLYEELRSRSGTYYDLRQAVLEIARRELMQPEAIKAFYLSRKSIIIASILKHELKYEIIRYARELIEKTFNPMHEPPQLSMGETNNIEWINRRIYENEDTAYLRVQTWKECLKDLVYTLETTQEL